MPVIKLSNGDKIRYKTIPIFPGVNRLDKAVALENLRRLKDLLDSTGVEFQIAYGTLLGAIRGNDFIDHDEDIDLILLAERKQELMDLLPAMIQEGFQIARYDRRGLLSIIRQGVYVDFYFFEKRPGGVGYCGGLLCPAELLEETTDFVFKGLNVKIPARYVDFFVFEYGEDWQTPIQYFQYEMPGWKKALLTLKAYVKEELPDWLYFKLTQSLEDKVSKPYLPKMEAFRKCYPVDNEED